MVLSGVSETVQPKGSSALDCTCLMPAALFTVGIIIVYKIACRVRNSVPCKGDTVCVVACLLKIYYVAGNGSRLFVRIVDRDDLFVVLSGNFVLVIHSGKRVGFLLRAVKVNVLISGEGHVLLIVRADVLALFNSRDLLLIDTAIKAARIIANNFFDFLIFINAPFLMISPELYLPTFGAIKLYIVSFEKSVGKNTKQNDIFTFLPRQISLPQP